MNRFQPKNDHHVKANTTNVKNRLKRENEKQIKISSNRVIDSSDIQNRIQMCIEQLLELVKTPLIEETRAKTINLLSKSRTWPKKCLLRAILFTHFSQASSKIGMKKTTTFCFHSSPSLFETKRNENQIWTRAALTFTSCFWTIRPTKKNRSP